MRNILIFAIAFLMLAACNRSEVVSTDTTATTTGISPADIEAAAAKTGTAAPSSVTMPSGPASPTPTATAAIPADNTSTTGTSRP
ncbi:MAG: hypothetical protein JJE51_11615 [Thermoanaerobaculia bacterium]|nr:hypothetical protein [Thermoanaerobaculia bacterium]